MTQATTVWSLDASDYQQLTEVQHLLQRPDMYIGPVERVLRAGKCMGDDGKIKMKQVHSSMGEEHVFVEIIGNIADNVQRSRENNVDPGHAEITMDQFWMTAKNYGMFIPIERHPDNGKWIPDLIFGHFRAGSNFNDTKVRLYIGKNGIGAKGVNGFSLIFKVDLGDPIRGLRYQQAWMNNMSQKTEPEITPYTGPGYTSISYALDFARFGVPSYDQEISEIYKAHCAGLSYTCQIPIQFNGSVIQIPDIFEYAKLFFPITKASAISYKDPNGAYDLCIVDTPNEAVAVSFVNGIMTPLGGAHLDAAYHVVTHSLIDYLAKAIKGITLTKRDIVDHVSVFISCRIGNPKFTSQTKEQLKSPEPKLEIPDKLLIGIKKWQLIEILYHEIERKQMNKLKKTDGKKKKFYGGGADPANWAAGPNSMQTVFILTEGLSADSYRLKFISQMPNGQGRNIFGSMPLHGKPRNVLNANFLKILEDEDFKIIKQHLGLSEETDYTNPDNFMKLNYGQLWMFPDPDNDGRHILGLILLFLAVRFYSLVKMKYFKFLRIPVARVTINGVRMLFYTMSALKRAIATLAPGSSVGAIDYFKGLGSSEDHHIQEDFANPRIVTFDVDEEAANNLLKAFHKERSSLRKEMINNWFDQQFPDLENYALLPVSVFVNYELIEYFVENVIRSIPEMMDGLKESQRKALFAALRKLRGKKAKAKINVFQVASHAAEITCYKHGVTCLADTIVMMTYNFIGSNNMPLFKAKGQFGTRNMGGEDAANVRYTSICLGDMLDLVIRKEDKRLEKRILDEGDEQECENFFPILPLHLANGQKGVGSGWSSDIPQHNPLDLSFWLQVRNLQVLYPENGYRLPMIRPYFKGYTGRVVVKKDGFATEGRFEHRVDGSVVITELPIGKWTNDYRAFLVQLEEEKIISGFDNYSTDVTVNFVIHKYLDGAPTLNKLKLVSDFSYKNMTVLYRTESRGIRPKIYNNINDFLEDFYKLRLTKYEERRRLIIKEIEEEIVNLDYRARFIRLVAIERTLEIRNRPEEEIDAEMNKLGLPTDLLDSVKAREFTQNRIDQLQKKIGAETERKAKMEQTRPELMWYTELEEFIVHYTRQEGCSRSTYESCNPMISPN